AAGWRSTYLKMRDRGSFDFPIAAVAAAVRWDGAKVSEARIAITALGSRPQLVADAARPLVGTSLDDVTIALAAEAVHKAARPMDNTSGTISERKPAIVSPRYRGKRGHPVALPTSLRDEIRAATSRATLHDVIHAHEEMRMDVDVDDPGVIRDVDRQEDLDG